METVKKCKKVEFDVIYDDGTRRRVKEGVLYEAEASGDMIFHNGTSHLEVLTAAAETALVSLHSIGPGLEVLALGMAISDESRAALACLAKFANDLLNIDSAEKQACFRLGQKDMQASAVDALFAAADATRIDGVHAALKAAAEMIRNLEVEDHDEK